MAQKQLSKNNNTSKAIIEKLPESEVKLTITVPKEVFEKHIEDVINRYGQEIKLDGFRSGKIPTKIIERTVGSEKILYEGAEEAVKKAYVNAILDEKIGAIGEPKIQIVKIARDNDFEFTAIVGILPEVKFKKWKDDVKQINKKFKRKEIKINESEVDREVAFLAKQRAKIITVSREAKKNDQVEVDFDVSQNNVALENGTVKKQPIVIGEKRFVPGFEEKLIGMKAGDEKEFDLTFPKKYHAKHLAGKNAIFNVKVNLVQERQIPEINDEFASGIGKFKNLLELKKNIHKGIEHEQKQKVEDEQKREIIDAIIEKVKLDVPEVLISREIETMMAELESDIGRINLNKQQYFEQLKTTEERLKEQWREDQAPKRVKAALAIQKIAKENEIIPETKEIEEEMNKILQYYKSLGQVEDKLDSQRLFEATKGNLINKKVFQYLMKI
ncbi:MAG: trigger factor [Patescibacteria group bacterium]|nr:trigger factor [Patescibacteria group bacterium]